VWRAQLNGAFFGLRSFRKRFFCFCALIRNVRHASSITRAPGHHLPCMESEAVSDGSDAIRVKRYTTASIESKAIRNCIGAPAKFAAAVPIYITRPEDVCDQSTGYRLRAVDSESFVRLAGGDAWFMDDERRCRSFRRSMCATLIELMTKREHFEYLASMLIEARRHIQKNERGAPVSERRKRKREDDRADSYEEESANKTRSSKKHRAASRRRKERPDETRRKAVVIDALDVLERVDDDSSESKKSALADDSPW